MSSPKVKYELENKLSDRRRIIDPVDKVHFKDDLIISPPDEYYININIDLGISNYFVLDLTNKRINSLYFKFVNIPPTIKRFEILIGRPRTRLNYIWEDENFNYEVNFPWGYVDGLNMGGTWENSAQIINFTKITLKDKALFIGVSSNWFKIA